MPSVRAQTLDAAKEAVCSNRAAEYGPPEDSFAKIAGHWNWWLGDRLREPITAFDVSQMMIGLKQARLHQNPAHADSSVDVCGYAACGAEIAQAAAKDA